jgi:hypothetical protein
VSGGHGLMSKSPKQNMGPQTLHHSLDLSVDYQTHPVFRGAVVWLPAVYKVNILLVLQRVQRLGLVSICGAMRTTPTAALECLFAIPPIDIYIEGLAVRAMARL